MKNQIMVITPAMAKTFLQKNSSNRTKRWGWINDLATMIKRGDWVTTHQGIAFCEKGTLLDGQHRLEAIIEANIPVSMMVSTNVSNDAFKVLDSGVKRTLADLTGINQKTAEICRVLSRIVVGSGQTSAEECLDIYNCGIGKIHDNLMEFCPSKTKLYSSALVRTAAVCLIADGHDAQYIKKLYSDLCHQKFSNLPNIAQAFVRQATNGKINTTEKSDLLARSLKIFNQGYKDMSQLQASDSEIIAATTFCREIVKNKLQRIKK